VQNLTSLMETHPLGLTTRLVFASLQKRTPLIVTHPGTRARATKVIERQNNVRIFGEWWPSVTCLPALATEAEAMAAATIRLRNPTIFVEG